MNDDVLDAVLREFQSATDSHTEQAAVSQERREVEVLKNQGDNTTLSAIMGKPTMSGKDHGLRKYELSDWPIELHKHIPKVDESYDFCPEKTERFIVGMRGDRRSTLCWGWAGTGKTTLPLQLAARLCIPVLRTNMSEDADGSRLLGSPTVNEGSIGWNAGDAQIAAKHGAWLVIDEFSSTPAGITMNAQAFMERGGNLNVPECPDPEWRTIEPAQGFHVIATDNTQLMGDETGSFANARQQSVATLDRFSSVIKFDYASMTVERDRLVLRFPDLKGTKAVDQLAHFGQSVRESFKKGLIRYPVSPRTLMDIAEDYLFFGDLEYAINISLLDKVPPSEVPIYEDLRDASLV